MLLIHSKWDYMATTEHATIWKELIDQYRASGVSAKEWCSIHDISYSSLRYQISKQRKMPMTEDIIYVALPEKAENARDVAIRVSAASVTIEITNHCREDFLEKMLCLLNPIVENLEKTTNLLL